MSNTTGGTTSSASASVTTSFATVTLTSSTSTSPTVITVSSTSTSSTSIPPSTTIVAPSTTSSSSSSSDVAVTSIITQTPSAAGTTLPPIIVTITSTQAPPTTSHSTTSSSATTSSPSSTPSALSASSSSSSGGLKTGGKIAIAVIIPVVVIAAAFIFGLLFWRKRKARKSTEELRKNEMAEYGFNPNNNPALVPVGAAAFAGNASDAHDEGNGYRGWGTTSSNRKASTTLGSNGRPANGANFSDSGSQPGGNGMGSEHYSPDPMLASHPEGGDNIGALGAGAAAGAVAGAGVAGRNRNSNADIHRGPSNASSAYSNGRAHSETSSEVPAVPGGAYYQEEVPYNIYNDAQPHHGPYGDGSYGGAGQPVIRDVQARRNTRIERAPTFPQTQGGIAQNF